MTEQEEEALLIIAMKKAVEVGLIPKTVDEKTYLKNWDGMRAVLNIIWPKIEEAIIKELKHN